MIVLPDFDMPTRSALGFLLRWIVPRLEPAHLFSALATRKPFQLSVRPSGIIIGVGHGEESIYSGQNEAIILEVGKYSVAEIRGKVIKLLSCQTALRLGPDLVASGAASFQGYSDDFVWVMDSDYMAAPWRDPVAAKALMPVVASLNILLDGGTSGDAFDVEVSEYSKNAEMEEDELVASCLLFNRDNLVLLGARDARVRARAKIIFPIGPPPLLLPVSTE